MLYAVLMGGKHPHAKIEVHDIVFAVADKLEGTYEQLRAGWFGTPKTDHIDAWMELEGVEGYRIEWSNEKAAPGEPRLFFLNFGGYEDGVFGEAHSYAFVVAPDSASAKRKGKQQLHANWTQPHTDALLEVDDCIAVETVAGRHLRLVVGPHKPIVVQSAYVPLD